MNIIAAVGETDETGKIFYRITGEKNFSIRIEQERGILKTAEVKNITQNFGEILNFAKTLAKGNVTAVSLLGMCDDFSDAAKLP